MTKIIKPGDQEPAKPAEAPKPSIISYPYNGSRISWYAYHPMLHGSSDREGAFEAALPFFMKTFNLFCSTCKLYNEQQTWSETVGGPHWRQEALKLLTSIERGGKSVYELEALATIIFDVDDRLSQRPLPLHKDCRHVGDELRHLDIGLIPGARVTSPGQLLHRGFAS